MLPSTVEGKQLVENLQEALLQYTEASESGHIRDRDRYKTSFLRRHPSFSFNVPMGPISNPVMWPISDRDFEQLLLIKQMLRAAGVEWRQKVLFIDVIFLYVGPQKSLSQVIRPPSLSGGKPKKPRATGASADRLEVPGSSSTSGPPASSTGESEEQGSLQQQQRTGVLEGGHFPSLWHPA